MTHYVADPDNPLSPYIFGQTKFLTVMIGTGPVFRPNETKLLKTGVSITLTGPAIVCAVQGITDYTRDPPPFRIPFTVLKQEDCFDITVPCKNNSNSPKTPRTHEHNVAVSIFALPLYEAVVNPTPILRKRSSPKTRLDNTPFRVDASKAPHAGFVVKTLFKQFRWLDVEDSETRLYHATAIFQARVPWKLYDTMVLKCASDPGIVVESTEYMRTEKTVRIYLLFDKRRPNASSTPPTSMSMQFHILLSNAPIVLRRIPEPVLTKIHGNGFEVRCPTTTILKKGVLGKIFIDNAYNANGKFCAVFFPRNDDKLDFHLSSWRERRQLLIRVTATESDATIKENEYIGNIFFFPANQRLFYRFPYKTSVPRSFAPAISVLPEHLHHIPGEEPPPSRTRARSNSESDEMDEDEQEHQNANDRENEDDMEDQENQETDSSDDMAMEDFSNLSLQTPPPWSRSRPREIAPQTTGLGAQDSIDYNNYPDEDAVERMFQEEEPGFEDEEENAPYRVLENAGEEYEEAERLLLYLKMLIFHVGSLRSVIFTIFTPMLNCRVYFPEGLDNTFVMLTSLTGRFAPFPSSRLSLPQFPPPEVRAITYR